MPYTEPVTGEEVATAKAVPVNTQYNFQAANEPLLGQQLPAEQSSASLSSSPSSFIRNNQKFVVYGAACCFGTSILAFVVAGYVFPGVMSFVGDAIGLVFTMMLAGFLIGCVLPACLSGQNQTTIRLNQSNPLLFAAGALLYPLSFGVFVGALTVHVLRGNTAKNGACVALVGFLLTVGSFAGGAYAVWDFFTVGVSVKYFYLGGSN